MGVEKLCPCKDRARDVGTDAVAVAGGKTSLTREDGDVVGIDAGKGEECERKTSLLDLASFKSADEARPVRFAEASPSMFDVFFFVEVVVVP